MVHASEAGEPAGNSNIGMASAGSANLPDRLSYPKPGEKLMQSTVKHLSEFPAEGFLRISEMNTDIAHLLDKSIIVIQVLRHLKDPVLFRIKRCSDCILEGTM